MPSPVSADTRNTSIVGIDRAGAGDTAFEIETDMRQQIDLVDQHQPAGAEHVRIFGRLVLALGYRQHHHLGPLAEIEQCRAYQVADVLDQDNGTGQRLELLHAARQHVRLQMAAGTGVDLDHRAAGGADALGVVGGGLVALYHEDAHLVAQRTDGAFQQAGFAGTRRTHQVQREHLTALEPAAIAFGQSLILGQNVLFEDDGATVYAGMQRGARVGRRRVRMVVVVRMRVVMIVRRIMAVGMPIGAVRMCARHRVADVLRIRAAAGRAHHASSISLIFSSSPATTRRLALPQVQRPTRRSSDTSLPQSRHSARPGVSTISRSAPSTTVFLAQTPKQKRTASGSHSGQLADFQPHPGNARIAGTLGADRHDPVGDTEFMHHGAPLADPRQLFADQHVDDALATEDWCAAPPCRRCRSVTSPIATAPAPAGCARIAASTRSASVASTTATNLPSFARYNGSRPRISQAPRDLLAHR